MPAFQEAHWEPIIDLKAAEELGLEIPPSLDIEARDPIRPSSSSQQHACEGIIGRAIGLRRRRAQFRRPTNSMIPRVRPNCRFGDSR
jgi:hypothetical protein